MKKPRELYTVCSLPESLENCPRCAPDETDTMELPIKLTWEGNHLYACATGEPYCMNCAKGKDDRYKVSDMSEHIFFMVGTDIDYIVDAIMEEYRKRETRNDAKYSASVKRLEKFLDKIHSVVDDLQKFESKLTFAADAIDDSFNGTSEIAAEVVKVLERKIGNVHAKVKSASRR